MSAPDQFQSRFALSDPALAHDQHAFTVDIDKDPVYGQAGRQLESQPADDLRHERACRTGCHEQRHLVLQRGLDHLTGRLCERRKDHTGNPAGNELLEPLLPFLPLHLHNVRILDIADDLNSLTGEVLVVAGQLKSRTVDILGRELDFFHIDLRREILQLQSFSKLRKFDYRLHTFYVPALSGITGRVSLSIDCVRLFKCNCIILNPFIQLYRVAFSFYQKTANKSLSAVNLLPVPQQFLHPFPHGKNGRPRELPADSSTVHA